jgi:hypothetical protein
VLSFPDQADGLSLEGERIRRRRGEVLLGDDEIRAGLEGDDVPRVRAEIDDAPDVAEGRGLVGADRIVRSGEADLLGPDVQVPVSPTIARATSPRSRFDVPTNPATNAVAGRS